MDQYKEKLNKLFNLQYVGIKMGLEQIQQLLARLGNPEKSLNFIHIAGTNGKGSVCSILASALKGCNYKVGFYSSPHLVSIRERFRINGKGITEEELVELIDYIWPTVEEMYSNNIKLTFFEVTVSIAILYFAKHNCDLVLWETGLGGRLDSTNTVTPIVTAITGIGIDHENFLGNTEEEIAKEKAGIIKNRIPVFIGEMSNKARAVIEKIANLKNAPIYYIDKNILVFNEFYDNKNLNGWQFYELNSNSNLEQKEYFNLPLSGIHQPDNMKLSYSILKYLTETYHFNLNLALKNIKHLKWYGRVQLLPDGKILDGAHNPQGIESLVKTLEKTYKNKKFTIIFGCLKEREPKKSITILSKIALAFIFIPINSPRPYFNPSDLSAIARKININIKSFTAESFKEALNLYTKDNKNTLITGSLYLAGEALLEYYNKEEIINI